MNCRKAQQWISLELDGELAPHDAAALAMHLAACPACRQVREQWRAVGEQLRTRPVPQVQTPESAWADVRRSIRLGGDTGRLAESLHVFGLGLRWAGVILAVFGLGASLFIALHGNPKSSAQLAKAGSTEVEWVETGLPDATPMVYEDAESGMTVIWVVENGLKEKGHAGS